MRRRSRCCSRPGHVGHCNRIDLHERPARLRGLADAVLVARRPHRRAPRLHDVGIASAIVRLRSRAVTRVGWDTTMVMLLADRYPPARRAGAVGWRIASLSLGYALSLALTGLTLSQRGYPLAFLVTSFAATAELVKTVTRRGN